MAEFLPSSSLIFNPTTTSTRTAATTPPSPTVSTATTATPNTTATTLVGNPKFFFFTNLRSCARGCERSGSRWRRLGMGFSWG